LHPEELFRLVGQALCPGEQWQADLTRLLGIRRDTISRWASGSHHLRPGHYDTLLKLLVRRRMELMGVEESLRVWLARQPKETNRR
jgi:hypothetical protein